MSCQPEKVTGYVDGALDPALQAEIEAHLAVCTDCLAQAEDERALRTALLGLPRPPLPDEIERRVQRHLVPRRPRSALRLLLPLAAILAIVVFAMRSAPRFVAWEMSRDHDHCFSRERLPTQVTSEEPESVMRFFEDQGTRMPVLPATVGGFELVGARYCWMPDFTHAVHVYYRRAEKGPLSLFVFNRVVEARGSVHLVARGHAVEVARVGSLTVGIVSDHEDDVNAFEHALASSRAGLTPSEESPLRQIAATR